MYYLKTLVNEKWCKVERNYNNFISSLKSFFIKPKVKNMKYNKKNWISQKEFASFIYIIMLVTGTEVYKQSFHKMINKFSHIWDTAGSTFLHKYLKEVMRLTVRRLANLDLQPSSKIFVKLNKYNFPAIIPLDVCESILSSKRWTHEHSKKIVAVLSVLSIFRVLPTKVDWDVSTIQSPFTGISTSLDSNLLAEACNRLGFDKGKGTLDFKLKGSLKAGPNGKVGLLTSSLDAMAFLWEPKHLYRFALWNISTYRYWGVVWTIWLYALILVTLPYLLLCLALGAEKPVMGRLSVVYDQPGKARVVAITNSWIQTSLFSLHEYLFNLLRKLPMDGTFDQKKPFNLLLKNIGSSGQTMYGFDLSAATDRLPIQIQRDILSLMSFKGDWWANLLRFGYYSSAYDDFIEYEVGQPMGAYSSFAMLAITHHVIVQCAAIRAGYNNLFTNYCILGDDVVIADDTVASEYLQIMKILGVSISDGKSVISPVFTEFAKVLRGPNIGSEELPLDISPIGAGLILQVRRHKYYICMLIFELLERGLVPIRSVFPQIINRLPKEYLRYKKLIIWFVAFHLRKHTSPGDRYADARLMYFYVYFKNSLYDELLKILLNHTRKDIRKWWTSVKDTLNKGIWITQTRMGMPDWSEIMLLPFVPSTYIIVSSLLTSFNDITKVFGKWWIMKLNSNPDHSNIIDVLDQLGSVGIVDLNFEEKEKVRMTLDSLYKLNKVVHDHGHGSTINDLEEIIRLYTLRWLSMPVPTYDIKIFRRLDEDISWIPPIAPKGINKRM